MFKDLKWIIIFNLAIVISFIVVMVFDYKIFHIIIELATIIVGSSMFVVSYFSKKYIIGNNLVIIGISYLFVGLFDFIHTFAFLLEGDISLGVDVITQFWISARFFESIIIVLAFSIFFNLKSHRYLAILLIESIIAAIVIFLTLFQTLPVMYIEEVGYTTYKFFIDFIVIGMFLLGLYFVNKNESRKLNKTILLGAISFKIISQIFFLVNVDNTQTLSGFVHIFKFLSFSGFFVIFVGESLTRPYDNIFRAFQKKEKELVDLSQKDSLTGLYNHSSSFLKIDELIEKSSKNNCSLGVIMIDVDDFKLINDTYGHAKGDEILKGVAKIFSNSTDPIVFAGRYGGDEFIIAFTKFTIDHVEEVATRIYNVTKVLSEEVELQISLSIGFAFWNQGENANDLIKRADKKMYEAKFSGKNTYSV